MQRMYYVVELSRNGEFKLYLKRFESGMFRFLDTMYMAQGNYTKIRYFGFRDDKMRPGSRGYIGGSLKPTESGMRMNTGEEFSSAAE